MTPVYYEPFNMFTNILQEPPLLKESKCWLTKVGFVHFKGIKLCFGFHLYFFVIEYLFTLLQGPAFMYMRWVQTSGLMQANVFSWDDELHEVRVSDNQWLVTCSDKKSFLMWNDPSLL